MRLRDLLLSLLSAILLSLSWYTPFSGLLLFVAFVPLLVLEADYSIRKASGCWKYYALTFIIWNIIDTYWIYHTTLAGAIGAIAGNSLQMFLIFALFRWVKKKTGKMIGYTFLVALWIAWEAFYYNAEISWPWLVLGNGFAKDIHLVQWYEYTGVLGGSLWIWLINLSIFQFITGRRSATKRQRVVKLSAFALLVLVPITVSLVRFYTYKEQYNPCHVVMLQPNIDPHTEKFGSMTDAEQFHILLQLATEATDESTDYVVAPETAISNVSENNLQNNSIVDALRKFVQQHPQVNFITGMTSYYSYAPGEVVPSTSRVTEYGAYDMFNASMQVNRTDSIPIYHKSKLVILAENTPYPTLFKFLSFLSLNLGGYVGNYASQAEREAFPSAGGRFHIGTAICYEAIYGEFYTEYITKGANVMAVISNDGWWGNTAGYRNLLHFSSLRAIETRRSIARSANTGISAVINQRGEIEARTAWWERCYLKGTINANDTLTFYVKHGDYLGRIATFVLLLILLYTFTQLFLRKKEVV